MSTDVVGSSESTKIGSFHIYESWLRLLGRLPRLLIAEDDRETRRALVTLFEQIGYEVRAVDDGSELLHRLEPMLLSDPGHWPPDLIMTDVRMPGLDAVAIVEQLRDVGWDIPVIVITGFGNPSLRERIEALECAEYFEKPVEADALDQTVSSLIHDIHG